MKTFDVSIDFGVEDSELTYIGVNNDCADAIHELSLGEFAHLTCSIVNKLYNSFMSGSERSRYEDVDFVSFIAHMETVNKINETYRKDIDV